MGKQIAVIGAGNGGSAIAGDLTLAGHRCRLFEFDQWSDNIAPIINQGGIQVTGVAHTGFAQVEQATTSLAEAVDGAELIMVATQSVAHSLVAKSLGPLVSSRQVVMLWPGSGGTLEFRRVFDEMNVRANPVLGEAATLPYACRRLFGPGTVNIHRIGGPRNYVAALPATRTPDLMAALHGVYDRTVVAARSVLEPALYNGNIIVHPAGAIFNMGRIEFTKGDFWMYKEGITPSVAKIIHAMDDQRQAVMTALGYEAKNYDEVMGDLLGMTYEEFSAISSKGPFSMQDRYVSEDVPMGVTLLASLGDQLGIPTPTFHAIVHIASVVNDTNYYATGRTLKNLGLDDLSADQLREYVHTGGRPAQRTL